MKALRKSAEATPSGSARFLLLVLFGWAAAQPLAADEPKPATTGGIDGKAAFARMKSLSGDWTGPKMMGHRMNVNFHVIAEGIEPFPEPQPAIALQETPRVNDVSGARVRVTMRSEEQPGQSLPAGLEEMWADSFN